MHWCLTCDRHGGGWLCSPANQANTLTFGQSLFHSVTGAAAALRSALAALAAGTPPKGERRRRHTSAPGSPTVASRPSSRRSSLTQQPAPWLPAGEALCWCPILGMPGSLCSRSTCLPDLHCCPELRRGRRCSCPPVRPCATLMLNPGQASAPGTSVESSLCMPVLRCSPDLHACSCSLIHQTLQSLCVF